MSELSTAAWIAIGAAALSVVLMAGMLVIALIMLSIIALPFIRSKREEAFAGDD